MNNTIETKDYKNLISLLSIGAEATARMDELQNSLHQAWLEMVDTMRTEYAKLQNTIASAEQAIEDAADLNPQWFKKQKSLKTPYGTVSYRKTTKLEVPNEEVSILLLEQLGQDGLPFLKTEKKLVLEALEKLDDQELERLRLRRATTQSFSVKYAKPDLGKAVAAAAKEKGGEP